MIAEESEYKGSPVLIIKRNENDKYPVSFGLSKARLILDSIDEIRKFVQSYDVALTIENTYEDSIMSDKTDASTVNSAKEFVYDFCNPQSLENTCPIGLSYFGEELCSNPLSWQDLYGYFLNAICEDYSTVIEYLKGKTISDFSSPLIFGQEDCIEGKDIYEIPLDEDEDISIYMHKNPNVLCKIIKILLEFCHIDYEDVKIRYEKQRKFIATEGERPPAYNENWIFFDFHNSQDFENTHPVFCSINGEEIYVSSWAKLFVAIIENELKKDNSALYFLYSNTLSDVSAGESFFFGTLTPAPEYHKLSNGYYVNLNYDLPALLEQIKTFCLYCGYQPEQVKIYGISEDNTAIKPTFPDFIP